MCICLTAGRYCTDVLIALFTTCIVHGLLPTEIVPWAVSVSRVLVFIVVVRFQGSVCLSSAKLRSTDSVNPRAVLSRVRPAIGLYSKHRDRRYWTGPRIGIRVSFRTHEETQLFATEEQHRRLRSGSRPSHLNVVLSKAALSGPSVRLRARAPCPLRVPCPVTACAQSAQKRCEHRKKCCEHR